MLLLVVAIFLLLISSPCVSADNYMQGAGSRAAGLKSRKSDASESKQQQLAAKQSGLASKKQESPPKKSGIPSKKQESVLNKSGIAPKKVETAHLEQTAVQAYQASREMYAQMFLRMRATPDNPRGAKLIAALQKVALKYLRMPITLVSESEAGGVTHLVYKATDPSVDLLISCNATKSGGEWVFTDHDFKGKNSSDVALDPFKAIASVFPQEISEITLGLTILGFGLSGCFVSAILLLIASFRVSVLWGLVTLCVPFGNLIFVACRWREAKNPFLVGFISFVVTVIGALIPLAVLQSLNGVQKMLPDFVPGMDNEHTIELIRAGLKKSKNTSGEIIPELNDDQTTQLIRNGLKNSPNLKLQRIN